MAVGLVFDIYRTLRHWWGWGKYLTFFSDLLFSAVAFMILAYCFIRANDLAFRFYMAWGSVLGLILYLRFCSRKTTWIILWIMRCLRYLSRFLVKVLMIPFHGLRVIMQLPYGVLRWFSLLLFRFGEATVIRYIKYGVFCGIKWLKMIFPSGKNG